MTLVDEVKARLTIVDVVSDYLALDNPTSRTPKALCPFHEERTPSFSVSAEHGSWRCWGACGVGGDMFEFVMRSDGIEFKEALEKLANKAGIEVEFRDDGDNRKRTKSSVLHDVNAIAEQFFSRQLEGALGVEALAYLEARGIDAQVARRRGIGFAPSGVNSLLPYLKSVGADPQSVVQAGLTIKGGDGAWRDMFVNRITIAIRDQRGNIVGFGARAMGDAQPKYLNTHETSIFNKSKLLYGLHWAVDAMRTTGRAIVVEGYMDVIAAQERGFKNVVACMGTAVTSDQLQVLSTVLPDDADKPPSVVLCLDADEAGQAATLRGLRTAISEFGRNSSAQSNPRRSQIDIRIASPVVSDHGEPKDPDEAIRNNGAEWVASIDQADEVMEYVIRAGIRSHNTTTDTGLDAALDDIEPYFDSIPPRTMRDQKLLADLAGRLEVDIDHLTNVLTRKRAAKRPVTTETNFDRQPRRQRNRRLTNVSTNVPMSTVRARWEIDLLACMVQYDYAIDHAALVEPFHFTDPVRTRVFQNLKIVRSVEACIAKIDGDDDALALVNHLRGIALSPTAESFEDQAAIIQIAEESAKRTRKEFLTREKKKEVQLAKENGNTIPDEVRINTVIRNREIKELVRPQHAGPRR